MNNRIVVKIVYVLLGFFIGIGIVLSVKFLSVPKPKEEKIQYLYVGERKAKLPFLCYSDSLYLPDWTIKKYPHGIVDTPKLAAEIGIAILFDVYGDEIANEFPFSVAAYKYYWTLHGRYISPNTPMDYFLILPTRAGIIDIQRLDGMVSFVGSY